MQLTWYGHATFRLDIAGQSILIDPFLTGNPTWGKGWQEAADGITHILLTHGHGDHIGDTVPVAKATGATVVSSFDICNFVGRQGIEKVNPGNHGGTLDLGGVAVSFVNAFHSSGFDVDGSPVYLGNPLGFIITAPGEKTVYVMGDTGIFGDMGLYNEIWEPKVGLVPIGDRFTMGGKLAALACRKFFNFDTVVPCHYGTFPMLDQTPDTFLAELGDKAGIVTIPEVGKAFSL
ncbi:metal-dependent hydrolase [Acuticoccus sediminis]|uniref:UPF0173 metal-dependent hydrolase DLJ53_30170 n=1 Tax=Acuticoccus sediminis TaxID=2184697 RepID=A0A8B2NKU6_9HYPH|nr:metal-dependent hydrolase [Acuticoccus sediminis]RAH96947.1 metal-dependent hydrolase [Acuticoccus sediminis]